MVGEVLQPLVRSFKPAGRADLSGTGAGKTGRPFTPADRVGTPP